MKTSNITLGIAALAIAASLTVTSCRKKDKTPAQEPDNEQTTAADNSLAENSSNDIIAMGSQLSENSGTLTTYRMDGSVNPDFMFAATCATITPGLTGTIVTSYTLDFGTTGCVSANDGRTRKGKLIYNFPNATTGAKWYRNPGFSMVVTSSGYSVDGNLVSISGKTVTNTTPSSVTGQTVYSGTNLTWSINSNISITKTTNEVISWSCSRTKELINSNDPVCYKGQALAIDWTKAKIKLNGTASGTNAKGESYTAVATDLVRDFTCAPDGTKPHRHPFISGKINYTPGTRPTRYVDYGAGTCDFNATVTINGQTFAVTLQ
ncbi:MAG: hypothetical protein H0W61_15490 [Bacteroidetes bacterium]|nr:hypothetical protein [Bacteroidota bacterium]